MPNNTPPYNKPTPKPWRRDKHYSQTATPTPKKPHNNTPSQKQKPPWKKRATPAKPPKPPPPPTNNNAHNCTPV
jgi:hypothetical protein